MSHIVRFNIYIGDKGLILGINAAPCTWKAYLKGTDLTALLAVKDKIMEALEQCEAMFDVTLGMGFKKGAKHAKNKVKE